MQRKLFLAVLGGDLLAMTVGMFGASYLVFETWLPWTAPLHGTDSIWSLLTAMAAGLLVGSYLSLRMGHGGLNRPLYGRAIAIVGTSVAVTMTSIVIGRGYWSRPFLAWSTVIWLLGSLLWRLVLRQRPWVEKVVIVSDEKQLLADLETSPHLEVIAIVDPAGTTPGHVPSDSTLVLDLRSAMSDQVAQFVASWNLSGAPIKSITALYEEHLGRFPLVSLVHGWELSTPVDRNEYAVWKRPIDLVVTLATAPLWVGLAGVVWLAVRIESRGAAIYSQTRTGKHDKPFTLYKFRTMISNAEENGPRFAEFNDPRLTRVGRVLRRFRIDEIPQLWNVVRGDLSLVGPRPERPVFVEEFDSAIPFYSTRTLVRPGITGWAQVNYGYADDLADTVEKLTFDLYYVKHMSLWLDLQILGKSVWTMLSGFGAR
jgi:lipopolysaccharide/colanic/teichoic acid biosynthesis glycosyltransferase